MELKLEIYPDQIKHIPANVEAQIRATTVFGAKFVDLVYPSDPSAQRLEAGQVLQSRNVTTEVNTVFENVVGVLDQIDTAKLNSVLSALAEGVRGQGERIGQATTDANQVFLALNPRSETVRADWQALKGFSDTYSVAAQDIVTILNAASTTSVTITNRAQALDALLLATIGFSNSGINLLAPNQANLIKAINVLEPTTNLLMKYNPEYTCLLVGAKTLLDKGGYESPGGNGYSIVLTLACLCFCCHLFSSVTTRTAIRTTCPSSAPRAAPAASRAVVRCPSSTTTGRCVSSSRTRASEPEWTGGRTRVSGSRAGPTTSRSPARCPSRRASATCSAGPRRDRFPTRVPRPMARRCTRRTAPRCGRGCRPHRRRGRRRIQARGRVRNRSLCPRPHNWYPLRYRRFQSRGR